MNDNARRLLAFGASAALIAVAFQIRGRGDDGGGDGAGGDDGNGTTLVCPPELADACEVAGDDYDVRVEDPAVTADALVAARRADEVDTDVWLVPRSWVEAVDAARELANQPPLLGEASAAIARSPVVLVVQESRAAALESSTACGGDIAWRCVGDLADGPWTAAGGQQNWGTVEAGIARPESASGIVTLGAAVAQYLDDPGFATNDFDGGLDNWLGKLAATAGAADARDPVADMLTRGPGHLAVLGTIEADADAAFGRDMVRVVLPEPVVTADLVAVPVVDESEANDLGENLADDGDLRDALAEEGWRVDDSDLADGLDADVELPDEPGIPRGDVLRVLLDLWSRLV